MKKENIDFMQDGIVGIVLIMLFGVGFSLNNGKNLLVYLFVLPATFAMIYYFSYIRQKSRRCSK